MQSWLSKKIEHFNRSMFFKSIFSSWQQNKSLQILFLNLSFFVDLNHYILWMNYIMQGLLIRWERVFKGYFISKTCFFQMSYFIWIIENMIRLTFFMSNQQWFFSRYFQRQAYIIKILFKKLNKLVIFCGQN